MFAYKKLKSSDAGILAFEAHKEYNINETNQSSFGVSLTNTQYSSASRDTYSSFSNDPFNHKRYFQLDHLFYKDPIFDLANLNNGINYIDQEKRLYDKANIISISQKNTGNGIQKGTVTLNGSFIDDKKGNIYDSLENLDDYPKDKDRVFYLAPVKGFKYTDLTRDVENGELVVNAPTTLDESQIDDSLYTNPIEYISCSIKHIATINCTGVDLNTGYIKVPHSNNYNFNDDDFTISFYYDADDTSGTYHLFSKSFTQTVAGTPPFPKLTENSGSFDKQEVDAGSSYPFEILVDSGNIIFRRSDGNTISSVSTALASGLEHYAFIKNGTRIDIIKGGATTTSNDAATVCRNKADLFIGSHGGTRNDVGNANGTISQMMIFNKALSSTQIDNVKNSITGTPYIGNVFYEQGFITITSPKVTNTTLTNTVLKDFNTSIGVSAGTIDDNYFIRSEGNIPRFSGSLTFVNEEFTNNLTSIGSLASALVPDNIFTVVENLARGSSLDIRLDTNAGGEYDPSFTISSTTKILPIVDFVKKAQFNESGVEALLYDSEDSRITSKYNEPSNILEQSSRVPKRDGNLTLADFTSSFVYHSSSLFSASIAANGDSYTASILYDLYVSASTIPILPYNSGSEFINVSSSNSQRFTFATSSVRLSDYIFDIDKRDIYENSESLWSRVEQGLTASIGPTPSFDNPFCQTIAFGTIAPDGLLVTHSIKLFEIDDYISYQIANQGISNDEGENVLFTIGVSTNLDIKGLLIHEPASELYGDNGVDTLMVYPMMGQKQSSTFNFLPLQTGQKANTFSPAQHVGATITDISHLQTFNATPSATSGYNILRFQSSSNAMYTPGELANDVTNTGETAYSIGNINGIGGLSVGNGPLNHYFQYDFQNNSEFTSTQIGGTSMNAGPHNIFSKGTQARYADDQLHISGSIPSVSIFSTCRTGDNTTTFNSGDPSKKIEGEIVPFGYADFYFDSDLNRYYRLLNFGNISETDDIHVVDNIADLTKSITKLSDFGDIKSVLPIGCGFSGASANEMFLKFDSDAAGLIGDGIIIQGLTELDPPADGNSFPKGLKGKFIPPKKLKLKVIFDAKNLSPQFTQYIEVTLRKKTDPNYDSISLYNTANEQHFTLKLVYDLDDTSNLGSRVSSPRADTDEGVAVAHSDYKRYVWTREIDIDDYSLLSTDELFPVVKLSSPFTSTENMPVNPINIRNFQFGVYDVEKPSIASSKFGHQNLLELVSDPITIPSNRYFRAFANNIQQTLNTYHDGLNKYINEKTGETGSAALLVSLRAYPYDLTNNYFLSEQTGFGHGGFGLNTQRPSFIAFDGTYLESYGENVNSDIHETYADNSQLYTTASIAAQVYHSGSNTSKTGRTRDSLIHFFNASYKDQVDSWRPVSQYRLYFTVVNQDATHPRGMMSGYQAVKSSQGNGFSIGSISSSLTPLTRGPYKIHEDSAAHVSLLSDYVNLQYSEYDGLLNVQPYWPTAVLGPIFRGTLQWSQSPLFNKRQPSTFPDISFMNERNLAVERPFASDELDDYLSIYKSWWNVRSTIQLQRGDTSVFWPGNTYSHPQEGESRGDNFGLSSTIVHDAVGHYRSASLIPDISTGGGYFLEKAGLDIKEYDSNATSAAPYGTVTFANPQLITAQWGIDLTPTSDTFNSVAMVLQKRLGHYITASIGPFTASGLTSDYIDATLDTLIVADRRRDNYDEYPTVVNDLGNMPGPPIILEGIENDPSGIGADNFIQVDFYIDNVKHFTRLIPGQTTLQNIMEGAPDSERNLGYVNNTTQFKAEYKVVSEQDVMFISSSIRTTEGFGVAGSAESYQISAPTLRIGEISISAATSSKTITRLDGPVFPQLEDTVEGTYKVSFSSSMEDTGSASSPYTTGSVEVNVLSVNEDGTQITVDQDIFITASMINVGESTFDLSVIDPKGNPNDPPRPLLKIALPINFKPNTEAVHELISDHGTAKLLNRTDDVLGFRVLDINNTIIHQGKFNDDGAGVLSQIDNKSITTPNAGEGKLLLFITGAASDLYPDGIISSSADNLKINITPVGSRLGLSTKTISGSFISSKIGKTLSASELESNNLLVSSSHSDTGTHGLFNTGNTEKVISQYVLDGGEHRIKTNGILFITASSEATGTKAEFTYYTYKNPINIGDAPPAELVGGSFDYSDPVSGQTVSYKIIGISGNSITLDNLNATPDNGIIAIEPSDISTRYVETTNTEFNLQFKNTHLIFENEFHCTVEDHEFTHTLNASARKYKSTDQGELANFATGSKFRPYVTTVGLYNDEGELLVVGKLAQPVKTSNETDTTFVVRYDT